jgi:hypothetical protein
MHAPGEKECVPHSRTGSAKQSDLRLSEMIALTTNSALASAGEVGETKAKY